MLLLFEEEEEEEFEADWWLTGDESTDELAVEELREEHCEDDIEVWMLMALLEVVLLCSEL